jgi:hypothetical protein
MGKGKAAQLLWQVIQGWLKRSPTPPTKPIPKPKERFPKEKPSSTKKCPQGDCPPATKEEILEDAKPGKVSSSRQYDKEGGFNQANSDFDAMTRGARVENRGGGLRTAELPDGSKVIVRPSSSSGQPTLEIQPLTGKTIKIRYE